MIAETIHQRGWRTMIRVGQVCVSACTYIWLSGRHSIMQRGASLCFHQAFDSETLKPVPEINPILADRLVDYGLTKQQAWALLNAAPPEDARCMNLIWGLSLGFRPQVVFTIGGLSACQAKFCQAIP
jgi:hypothetical protein